LAAGRQIREIDQAHCAGRSQDGIPNPTRAKINAEAIVAIGQQRELVASIMPSPVQPQVVFVICRESAGRIFMGPTF